MTAKLSYLDGHWLTDEIGTVPLDDLGLQRGFGVFETLRAGGSILFHPERHLARLKQSAAVIGLPYPWSDQELSNLYQEALAKTAYPKTSLKVIATGGSATFLDQEGPPRLILVVQPYHAYPPALYQQGASLRTSRLGRILPEAKSLSYLPSVMAWRAAQATGDHEALFVSPDDQVLECATANFFAVIDGGVVTAAHDILRGTTRELILGLARDNGYQIAERPLHLAELAVATEAFITSVNRRIMPIVRIDGQAIGTGTIGPVTKHLTKAFHHYEETYFAAGKPQGFYPSTPGVEETLE